MFFSLQKDATTKSHTFDISVDNKNNYCFYVQGIIPSRTENRNGQESTVLCTTVGRTILDGTYLVKSVALPSAFQQKGTSILNVFYMSIKCDA